MPEKHYFEQRDYAENYLLAYIRKPLPEHRPETFRILLAGCAEAGEIEVLSKYGYTVSGCDIARERIALGKTLNPEADICWGDLTDPASCPQGPFDLVVLRDVIEHITDKAQALKTLSGLLRENGHLFVTFPLKYSPYAAHQQNSKLKHYLYLGLYPAGVIRKLGKRYRQNTGEMLYLKRNALSYRAFRKLIKKEFTFRVKEFFIFRPIFRLRFDLPILRMPNLPGIREFALGGEFLLQKKKAV